MEIGQIGQIQVMYMDVARGHQSHPQYAQEAPLLSLAPARKTKQEAEQLLRYGLRAQEVVLEMNLGRRPFLLCKISRQQEQKTVGLRQHQISLHGQHMPLITAHGVRQHQLRAVTSTKQEQLQLIRSNTSRKKNITQALAHTGTSVLQ
jgi:hypothetical protein